MIALAPAASRPWWWGYWGGVLHGLIFALVFALAWNIETHRRERRDRPARALCNVELVATELSVRARVRFDLSRRRDTNAER